MSADSNKTVMILGVTGMLGHVLYQRLRQDFDVHGTARDPTHAQELGIHGPLHQADALEWDSVEAALTSARPDVIINAVGLIKQIPAGSKPIPAITVNALFPHLLRDAAAKSDAHLVHISTDCVFRGTLPTPARYTESAVPDATDLYGITKQLGEVSGPAACTLRTSILGPELERSTGLFEWVRDQRGTQIQGFKRAIFSGLTTNALADVIASLLHRPKPLPEGLWHVSSTPISKFELLTRLNDRLDLDLDIVPAEEPEINRALDSLPFQETFGIDIPEWSQMIEELGNEVNE